MGKFYLRMPDNTWQQVGAPGKPPLMLMQDNGQWVKFTGGGGSPLNLFTKDATWITATTAGELSQAFGINYSGLYGLYSFRDLTGWVAQVEQSMWEQRGDTDWTVFADGGKAPIEGTVFSIASQGELYDSQNPGYSAQRYTNDAVWWVALPMAQIIAWATAGIKDHFYRLHPDTTFDLDHVDVEFHCYGWSVEKDKHAKWTDYYNPGANQRQYNGQGRIAFDGIMHVSGQGTEMFGPYQWPVVRNLPFQRDSGGETVWEGDLNGLPRPWGIHGAQNPFQDPTILTHQLHKKYWGASGLQYHLYTSEVPEPGDYDIAAPHTIDNQMRFSVWVNCYFRINEPQ